MALTGTARVWLDKVGCSRRPRGKSASHLSPLPQGRNFVDGVAYGGGLIIRDEDS